MIDCNCDYLSNISPTCICEPSMSIKEYIPLFIMVFTIIILGIIIFKMKEDKNA